MTSFQLFRVRVLRSKQLTLFDGESITAPKLLRAAIAARPSIEVRHGYTWHIGNIEALDNNSVYFALGRSTDSALAVFDEETGDFVEAPFPSAPYTHVIVDLTYQVCAVAAKAQLSPTASGIARQLQRLLNTHSQKPGGLTFAVDPLQDPETFLKQLHAAYAITRFSVEFTRPNPWDSETDFQAPLQKTLQQAGGTRGKATMAGESLDAEPLTTLTRAAAATGDSAEAYLRTGPGVRPIRKSTKGNPVVLTAEDARDVARMKQGIVGRLRERYLGVRRGDAK